MMRRTPFKRPVYLAPPPAPVRPATRTATYAAPDAGNPVSVAKECPLRSLAYRRLVAAMPCANCGAPAPCQAAHANYGKGMGLKTDDRTCFPLCPRCHSAHDQGGHIPRGLRREYEALWGAETRAAILAAGTWPKTLPLWNDQPKEIA